MYGITISWHFFASSHGKGIVDGVGATVKGAVWRRVASSASSVKTGSDFADVARDVCPNILIKYVPTNEILDPQRELEEHWDNVKCITNLRKMHCVRPLSADSVEVRETSNDEINCFILKVLRIVNC
ncbi:hypothetical protein QAD02_020212 [Eretmocerus hayati]|uniref:Uncharacterized protein n=1 Tax=Eretmocerus hayati TaxID=131215 RepID=A0ACC2PRL0_9HYME|nr:hypothetical protein QAD02_020212 [Eretmocerus hayati]